MKRSDSGDFCVLYVEPSDDRASLFNTIAGQKKPIVILLAEQAQIFQRPEDFTSLKHVKRQLDVPIVFVIPSSERLAQLAGRNGFPVYSSMDALSNALAVGQMVRQRVLNRPTSPLGPASSIGEYDRTSSVRKTLPLSPSEEEVVYRKTGPLKSGPLYAPSPKLVVPPQTQEPSRRLPVALIVLMTIALVLAGLGSFLVLFNKLPAETAALSNGPVGHIEFLSSEQLSENSSQGIADQVYVGLSTLVPPAPGKRYYAWLLSDKGQGDMKAISLGILNVSGGRAQLSYKGDSQHTNLLMNTGRFLVTEEDANVSPIAPSLDLSAWRYYGEFSQTPINAPDNTKHFSYLDHLRHLLAADPDLDKDGLPGGLNTWFFRNAGKVLEWTGSMREQWEESKDVGFVRRQTTRTLAYLDGTAFVKTDLPPGMPLLVNDRLATVGLLDVNGPNQNPPCYLTHINRHLNGLLESSAATPEMRKSLAAVVDAMNNVTYWLSQVRRDALQIMKMSDQQLQQPETLSLINDMIGNANNAYVGQQDPATGQMRQGVIWIHQQIQAQATMQIFRFNNAS